MSSGLGPTRQSDALRIDRPLLPVALGTVLVLVTYVTPIASAPATAAATGAGAASRAWILSSMSVGLAGALLVAGVVGDRLGRRRAYVAGLVVLALGAVGCAVAQEPGLFIGARVVEGVGGAAVLACGLAALAHRYPAGPQRALATSVWGASVGLGIGSGLLLAPAVGEVGSGWRETYAATAVLALALVWPSRRRLAESAAQVPRGVDTPGLVLLVAGLTLAVSALTQARNGVDLPTVLLGVAALAALVGFAVVERRVAQPLVEPSLLAHPRFRAATGGSLVLGLGMIAFSSFVPTLVQVGYGHSLWAACLPTVGWAGTSVVTSMLVTRVRHPMEGPRPVAAFLVVVAAGQLLGGFVGPGTGLWRLVLASVVAGLGTGVLNALLGREAIAAVPPDAAAMGSGANNTARYLGAAIGITLFVTVATHTGATLLDGWNHAVLVAAALTLGGAALVAAAGRRVSAG